MGGGDKALRPLGGPHSARPRDRSHAAAGRRAGPQREWRSRRASRDSGCRSSPTAFPISPARSPAFSPGSTGPRPTGRIAGRRQRADRRAVSAARPRRAPVAGNGGSRRRPRLRRLGRPAASGRRAVAGAAARGVAARRSSPRGSAKSMCGPAAIACDVADFPEERSGLDPFFNANRPDDLDRAAALLDTPNRHGASAVTAGTPRRRNSGTCPQLRRYFRRLSILPDCRIARLVRNSSYDDNGPLARASSCSPRGFATT